MFSASVSAWQTAKSIDASHVQYKESEKEMKSREERAMVKRGARCVDELPSPTVRKRVRTSKKDLQASHAAEKLVGEAMITIEKLMQRERGDFAILLLLLFLLSLVLLEGKRGAGWGGRATFERAVRHPARAAKVRDVLHQQGSFARHGFDSRRRPACQRLCENTKGRQGKEEREKTARLLSPPLSFSGRVRSLCCSLVVALWRACCLAPYFKDGKKSSDSFRPFVCGVLYALKRGFSIRNGMEVVPASPSWRPCFPPCARKGSLPSPDSCRRAATGGSARCTDP